MKALLIEPDYRTKYPNLALMKISTKLKSEDHIVEYFKGKRPVKLEDSWVPISEIYITTLFTYEAPKALETIKFYQTSYPNAKIQVGGILATLMPDLIEKETGIKPFIGYSKELDLLVPDYDLIKLGTKWDEYSFVFTTRGCVNRCAFCAVHRIESEHWINPNWRTHIDLRRPNVMISDNNLTSYPIEHFRDIMDYIREKKLVALFDNGLDCRLWTEEHTEAIQGVKIHYRGLRFAFDGLYQDGYIQKTIKSLLEAGIHRKKFLVYLLFNFNDKPQDAEYRARELVKLGVDPYPQRYVPLDKTVRRPHYVGKYWTHKLAHSFRVFYYLRGYYIKMTFPEFLRKCDLPEYPFSDDQWNIHRGLIPEYEKYPWTGIKPLEAEE